MGLGGESSEPSKVLLARDRKPFSPSPSMQRDLALMEGAHWVMQTIRYRQTVCRHVSFWAILERMCAGATQSPHPLPSILHTSFITISQPNILLEPSSNTSVPDGFNVIHREGKLMHGYWLLSVV